MSNMDVGCNLQWSTSSTMTSRHHFHSIVTQSCQNMSQLCQCNCVKLNLYAYIPYWKVLKHLICQVWMWEAIKGGLQPQQWHHDINFTWLSPTIANICLSFFPRNSGNETLYICPIWMWEAICSGLQPQPWHHGIISNEQSLWITNIWCWKS
jgi:hypothetical protein